MPAGVQPPQLRSGNARRMCTNRSMRQSCLGGETIYGPIPFLGLFGAVGTDDYDVPDRDWLLD